jgi:CRISPR-associated endonuclease/helicase Cas3
MDFDRSTFFDEGFRALTGHNPLRWQQRLFAHFVMDRPGARRLPDAPDIPTGLGKTSVIPIWLLALAAQAREGMPSLPRRLVYVVNRRTVVDQATDVAMDIREALRKANGAGTAGQIHKALSGLCIDPNDQASPLAISTLRGELADNQEWQADPARPAIIVGTVDMIGSRLLFSGYGVSRRMRPFHAGLIGQDVLLVHDEAHLTPAFGTLVKSIVAEQEHTEPRPLRLVELTATQRGSPAGYEVDSEVFSMTEEEMVEEEVARRLGAHKTLRLHRVDSEEALAAKLADLATAHDDARARVVVYVKSPEVAGTVVDQTEKRLGKEARQRIGTLTGTMRGYERDLMASKDVERVPEHLRGLNRLFRGFQAKVDRVPPNGTEYLVSTSAGEVGVDLDADHMVCDLTTFDSMIQRLGRVNRLGRGRAMIDVVQAPRKKIKAKETEPTQGDDSTAARLAATADALSLLPPIDGGYDASPRALRSLIDSLGPDGVETVFSPLPRMARLTDVLLDGWSLTRVDDLPGRPSVERWLHGVDAEPPQTYVAWREEVPWLVETDAATIEDFYELCSIRARELLRDSTKRIIGELGKLAKRRNAAKGVILPAKGPPRVGALADLIVDEDEITLRDATVVLDCDTGGLRHDGLLDEKADERVEDVAAKATSDNKPLLRVLIRFQDGDWSPLVLGRDAADDIEVVQDGMAPTASRLVRAIREKKKLVERSRFVLDANQSDDRVAANANVHAAQLVIFAAKHSTEGLMDAPSATPIFQELAEHLAWTVRTAMPIVEKTGLKAVEAAWADAVLEAAKYHDYGKNRDIWQGAIGHRPPRDPEERKKWKPWAKSDGRSFDSSLCGGYRHEFGSLMDAARDRGLKEHPEHDLVLHLIAAHHGWSRPHFEPGAWDPEANDENNSTQSAEAMRRFMRLQRRFGRWGLAWLEALVRAADYAATKQLAKEGAKRIGLEAAL